MEHYPEVTARKSPHRGQMIVYQSQQLISSTEDSNLTEEQQQFRRSSLSTSPLRTTPYTDSHLRIKKI